MTVPMSGVRKAALLALLESHALKEGEVRPPASDADPGVKAVAALWLEKAGAGGQKAVVPGGLGAGAQPYSDRRYVLKEVPLPLQGLDFIQTANEDDGAKGIWCSR